jgi:carbamoyl-phosphate synthase small subunit
VFRGRAFGADATIAGECVFNTSMTGYQEIITDPSYFGQIVTMTAVQIGNYGVNAEDTEASVPKCSGFVVRELSPVVSNWRSHPLPRPTTSANTASPGISEIDTRAPDQEAARRRRDEVLPQHPADQRRRGRGPRPQLAGHGRRDYVKDVSCKEPFLWRGDDPANFNAPYLPVGTTLNAPEPREEVPRGRLRLRREVLHLPQAREPRLRGAGVSRHRHRRSGPRAQPRRGLPLQRPRRSGRAPYIHQTVTACAGFPDLRHLPRPPDAHARARRDDVQAQVRPPRRQPAGEEPGDGQGLDHGAEPRFRHRPKSLENRGAKVTEINLNDNTVEGLRHKELPIFSCSITPRPPPGPNDADPLFVDFYKLVEQRKAGKI